MIIWILTWSQNHILYETKSNVIPWQFERFYFRWKFVTTEANTLFIMIQYHGCELEWFHIKKEDFQHHLNQVRDSAKTVNQKKKKCCIENLDVIPVANPRFFWLENKSYQTVNETKRNESYNSEFNPIKNIYFHVHLISHRVRNSSFEWHGLLRFYGERSIFVNKEKLRFTPVSFIHSWYVDIVCYSIANRFIC